MNNLSNIIYMISSSAENRTNTTNLSKKAINRTFVLNLFFTLCFSKMAYIGLYRVYKEHIQ